MKKLLPPQLFYFSIIVMLVLNYFYPITKVISFPVNLAGLLLFPLGIFLAIKGKAYFKKVGTNISTFNNPDFLVTNGLYKFSRNPMYLGFVLGLLGVSILLGSLSAIIVVIIFTIIMDRWYINFEEKMLFNKFPEEYTVYKINTRRWI